MQLAARRWAGMRWLRSAIVVSLGVASWAIERAAIDPFAEGSVAKLRTLFREEAGDAGVLGLEGLGRILAIQRAADGVGHPFPIQYTTTIHTLWRLGQQHLKEDSFLKGYPNYFRHREYLWREWLVEAFELPGPMCTYPGMRSLCCGSIYGPRGYASCFNATYPFEDCCGSLQGGAEEPGWDEEQEAQAQRFGSVEATTPAVRGMLGEPAVAAAERGRAAMTGCTEVSCTCVLRREGPRAKRIAVMVVGVRQRYYPLTTLRHVVAPAAKQGYDVDYLAMLSWSPPLQQRQVWSKTYLRPSRNPMFANSTKLAMQDYLVRRARRYGARQVQVHLMDPGVSWDPLPANLSRLLGRDTRTHPAFLNYLLRLKKVEMLWNRSRAALDPGEAYTHVILVRDDVHWVDDINLADFPDPGTVYSQPLGFLCQRPHLPSHPSEHVFVMGALAAERLLRPYTEFYDNPSPALDTVDSTEQFWYVLAALLGVKWQFVKRNRLPYFLSQHMLVGNETVFCIRGTSRAELARPTASCVHPSLVRHVACDDL